MRRALLTILGVLLLVLATVSMLVVTHQGLLPYVHRR